MNTPRETIMAPNTKNIRLKSNELIPNENIVVNSAFFSKYVMVNDADKLNSDRINTKIKIITTMSFSDLLVLKINAFFSKLVFIENWPPNF